MLLNTQNMVNDYQANQFEVYIINATLNFFFSVKEVQLQFTSPNPIVYCFYLYRRYGFNLTKIFRW